MKKNLSMGFDEALAKIPEALSVQGFGVLTEVDVQATLKKKLGADFRRYKILGACSPAFAHQALNTNLEIGLMMPCNVVVYEDDSHHTVVMAIDPTKTMGAVSDPKLMALAETVKTKLSLALEALG